MLHHAADMAAKPDLSLSIFSARIPSRKARNGGGERPSFSRALARLELRLGRTSAAEKQRRTSIRWASSASYPVFCSGSRFGAIRRPAALGLLLRFHHPSRSTPDQPGTPEFQRPYGSRFLPEQVCKPRQRTPHKLLPGPAKKADLRHLGAGPARSLCEG
jgi:hypothetical protein